MNVTIDQLEQRVDKLNFDLRADIRSAFAATGYNTDPKLEGILLRLEAHAQYLRENVPAMIESAIQKLRAELLSS